ncbi:hypothetical protein ACFVZJ_37260 [Streptomyces sp. NPDC058322]|uniref:Uncharacterized protein n=1 Tax=Streptomyces sanglieri TaxID=193460 RepID=A0ABW2WLB0_9ACTN
MSTSDFSAGGNAHHFFHRVSADMAQWIVDRCDEVAAKGPQTSTEFRRMFCDRILDLRAYGEADADHFTRLALKDYLKWIEKAYDQYDHNRSAQIITCTSTDSTTNNDDQTTGSNTAKGNQDKPAGPNPADITIDTRAQGETSGTKTGTITVSGTKCGGTYQTGQTTEANGTGHQGTLFTIRYGQLRLSLPEKRRTAKDEVYRLTDAQNRAARQVKDQEAILENIALIEKADPAIESLINTHRTETTLAGALKAAGKTAADLGLTDRSVTWLDTQLKAM